MIDEIRAELFALQDLKYKNFHATLIPAVDPDTIIGVRTPALRSFSKKIKSNENIDVFITSLPHKYYEENNLHAFLINEITDYDSCIDELDRFLPFVDNWATCDGIRPKCFKKHHDKLIEKIALWLTSSHTYTVRFAIEMLMVHFLEDDFNTEYLHSVSKIISDDYYIKMMIAWYFATALAKQWESAFVFIEENRLPVWIHNKTIQKAVESYRITPEQKAYLRKLRRKV